MALVAGAVALVAWGPSDFPRYTVALLALVIPLLLAPSLVPEVIGRRGRLVVRERDVQVVLVDAGVERPALTAIAVIALAGPFVASWEQARTGADLGPVTGRLIWVLPLFGVAGLWWVSRARRTSITLTRQGIVLQRATAQRVLAWADLPDFSRESEPRLLSGLWAVDGPFPVYQLRSDPTIVAEVLDFYRTHPMSRGEIGTPAFAERLRRGDL